jgi:hypothetical protein
MKYFINRYSFCHAYERKAGVYFNMIRPYPIQSAESIAITPGSFKHWLSDKFSPDLCRLFFFPFNEKYTNGMYNEILPQDPQKTPDPKSQGYNRCFCYPIKGLDHFVDKLAVGEKIHYGKKAIKLDLDRRILFFEDGSQVEFDRLISTIPLCDLLDISGFRDYDLPYTSVQVLNIGATRGRDCPDQHWLYLPGEDQSFFRVGFYSNVEKSFAPPGRVSIYVEKAGPPDPKYAENVIRKLYGWEWIEELEAVDSTFIRVAYTWKGPDTDLRDYLDHLESHGVESIGRYGQWRFQGIAESLEEGLGVAW